MAGHSRLEQIRANMKGELPSGSGGSSTPGIENGRTDLTKGPENA